MKRGDLVTIALQGDYGKPSPALVIQSDFFPEHPLVTCLPLTSDIHEDMPLIRVGIEPDDENNLSKPSQIMVDKAVTVPRAKIKDVIGHANPDTMPGVTRALAVFLGIA